MTFANVIIKWYEQNKRDLPWRNTTDPYRIWISEIILQQTQVAQGYDYYLRFIKRFPNVHELASAEETEVLRLWQGLGYYSRARNLHAAAKQIIANGGLFPNTYESVRALKGVGDYTASAVCAFAYNLPCAAVDGNVYRVLSRYLKINIPIDTTQGKRVFADLAREIMGKASPSVYNQAIMDFGALMCVPHTPQCTLCPLADSCLAFADNCVSDYPMKSKRVTVVNRYFTYFFLRYGDGIYLHKRSEGDIWAGLYEPYLLEHDREISEKTLFKEIIQNIPDAAVTFRRIATNIKHVLTHRRLNVCCYEVQLSVPINVAGYEYISLEALERYPVSKLVSMLLDRMNPV